MKKIISTITLAAVLLLTTVAASAAPVNPDNSRIPSKMQISFAGKKAQRGWMVEMPPVACDVIPLVTHFMVPGFPQINGVTTVLCTGPVQSITVTQCLRKAVDITYTGDPWTGPWQYVPGGCRTETVYGVAAFFSAQVVHVCLPAIVPYKWKNYVTVSVQYGPLRKSAFGDSNILGATEIGLPTCF